MAGKKQEKLKVVERKPKKQVVNVEAATEQAVEMDPCSTCERKCPKVALDGVRALRRSACRKVKGSADAIAASLCEGAKRGDRQCAQMLLMLAGEQMENPQAKMPEGYRTAAMDLADEEEYIEPGTENFAETGEGGREPEGRAA